MNLGRGLASVLAATAAMSVVLGMPALAGASANPNPASSTLAASPRPASRLMPLRNVSLCAGVNPKSVSKVVSLKVTTATARTQTVTIDQKRDVTATATRCMYAMTGVNDAVELDYFTLSKSLPMSVVESDFKADVASGTTFTVFDGLGAPAFYLVERTGGETTDGMLALKGNKIVLAVVGEALPTSKLAALTKLAMANFF